MKILEYTTKSEPIFIIRVRNGKAYIMPPGRDDSFYEVVVIEGYDVSIQANEKTTSLSRIAQAGKVLV